MEDEEGQGVLVGLGELTDGLVHLGQAQRPVTILWNNKGESPVKYNMHIDVSN